MSKEGKKTLYKKVWVWVLVIIIISVAAGCGKNGSESKTSDSESTSNSDSASTSNDNSKKEDSKVNYDNFMNVQMGENYSDVVAVLGDGTEESSSEISSVKSSIYSWKGSGFQVMNVTVENNVVVGKTQTGLKKDNPGITLENYNKINRGMKYEDMTAIIGEGEITSETKLMNFESILYSYINKDGTNANFTFSNGVLADKAQFNLK